ncbi:25898_t:CDS:2, partial [Gigaspora rosea]
VVNCCSRSLSDSFVSLITLLNFAINIAVVGSGFRRCDLSPLVQLLDFAAGVAANVATMLPLLEVNFVDVWVGVGTTEGGILLLMLALRKWYFAIGIAVTDSETCF